MGREPERGGGYANPGFCNTKRAACPLRLKQKKSLASQPAKPGTIQDYPATRGPVAASEV
ncbi:hypothetical protein GCM10027346_36560 [Hymenobacter seoulensis]